MFVIKTYSFPFIKEGLFSPPAPGKILSITSNDEYINFHVIIDTKTNINYNYRIYIRTTEEPLGDAFGANYLGLINNHYVFYEMSSIKET